jgi:DNA-binding NtrC family response regulator
MVTSLLVIGLDPNLLGGVDAEVGSAASAEDAFASLSQRGWDVLVVGSVPDASPESLVTSLARRYPSIPVVLVDAHASRAAREAAWDVIAPGSPATGVVRRAAEVSRLRREVTRLSAERDDRPCRGDVAHAFERGSIREMERLMIMERLARMNQNRTHSAASLDISVRTLRNKLREYRESVPVPLSPVDAR